MTVALGLLIAAAGTSGAASATAGELAVPAAGTQLSQALSPHDDSSGSVGTLTDLGPESANGHLLEPVGVNSSQEVAFYGGAVWKNGTVIDAQAPSSNPTASFTATAINDAGVVVGYANNGSGVYVPAYWNTASSSSFTEVPVSSLTVNGSAATGGYFTAVDDQGEAVGSVWNASGSMYYVEDSSKANNAGLYIAGSGGVPSGSPSAQASAGGSPIYEFEGVSAGYEDANMSETTPELLIARGAPDTVTTTNIYEQEGTPVWMATNGTLSGDTVAQNQAQPVVRTAAGAESTLLQPSGYSGVVVSVNSSGTAVGWSVPTTGTAYANPIIWSPGGGTGQLLLSEVTGGSSWTNSYAVAINDQGYVVGWGEDNNIQSSFLISTNTQVPPVVNSTGDAPASDPSSGSCNTGNTVANAEGQRVPECTLRAAIQTVNQLNDKSEISFDIPAAALSAIKIGSALPSVTAAGTVIDGTTESGGMVTIDGAALGTSGDCLTLAASEETVQGMDLSNCPIGIELQTGGGDKIQGNIIGLAADGSTAARGGVGVQVDAAAAANTIGGEDATQGNVISDQGAGIILLSSGNDVQSNLLGTDQQGSGFAPDQIDVSSAGANNTIGGKAAPGVAPGNVMVAGGTSRFAFGVLLTGSDNTVAGNTIGTDQAGKTLYAPSSGYPARDAVMVAGAGSGNVIGGAKGSGNLIAGAAQAQVLIDGAGALRERVVGNRIGAGSDGDVLETKDSVGVDIAGANGDVVGAAGDGNTITGQKYGIKISHDSIEVDFTLKETENGQTVYNTYALTGTDTAADTSAASVKDNLIGPLPDGSSGPETPEVAGILDEEGDGDLIGPRNVISWNETGIKLDTTKKIGIEGNLIGTDSGGLDALPNAVGVWLSHADETQLGAAGEPDTISGNPLGVEVDGRKTTIQAERIGPDSRGDAVIKRYSGKLPAILDKSAYGRGGVDIGPGDGLVVIGGIDDGEGVTIGGVDGDAISATSRIGLFDDHIGIGVNGSELRNKGDGLNVLNAHVAAIVGTVIAHDDGYGVSESDGGHAADILDTRIYDNRKGGIRIDGLKAPAAPKLISAVNTGSGTDVKLDLTVPAGDTGLLQLYATPDCEAHGAGKKRLDAVVHISAGQHYALSADSEKTEPVGTAITATLTTGSGGKLNALLEDDLHTADGATSEFSGCVLVKPSK